MNRQYVIDHDIVGRYLRHELSEAERDEFEIFYLDDPETLDELEALASLQRELAATPGTAAPDSRTPADDAAEDSATPLQTSATGCNVVTLPDRPQRAGNSLTHAMNWLWPLATAAALVVGIGLGARLGSDGSAPLGLRSASVLHVEVMRGADQPTFILPDGDSVLIKVAVGHQESSYQLRLTGAGGFEQVSESLAPDEYGDVGVLVQASSLPTGPMQLLAIGRESGRVVLSAPLRKDAAGASMD